MDEFLNGTENTENSDENTENKEYIGEVQSEGAQPQGEDSQPDFTQPFNEPQVNNSEFSPVYNPVQFSPVAPIDNYKPMSRGLKIFALIMVAVIVLTGTCFAGYYIGRNSVKIGFGSNVSVDLASKPADTDEMTTAQVYAKVNKSIVGIRIYNTSGQGGQASGIIFSEDGYIVTNDHIYSEIPAAKFRIYTYDGTEYDAEFVAGDQVSDLAVLKINATGFTPAEFGNSDELIYGESVVAVGRPSDATDASSITRGVISATNRRIQTTSSYSARLIQTDSAINPGSSGGALALGVANHILMLENAVYSVLSPEGFASILWKDSSRSGEACEMMKLTAQDLYRGGIVEEVIPEPVGGAQRCHAALFERMDAALRAHLKELCRMSDRQLADQRYKKYRQIGETRNA